MKTFDFKMTNRASEELDDLVDGYKWANVTRSKLIDIALTIILSDEVRKENVLSMANQVEIEPRSRQTFIIKNESVISAIDEIKSRNQKRFLFEYAVYYLNQRLIIKDDFKSLLMDYIKAGGVLL